MSLLWISAFVQGQVLDFEHDLSFRKKNQSNFSRRKKNVSSEIYKITPMAMQPGWPRGVILAACTAASVVVAVTPVHGDFIIAVPTHGHVFTDASRVQAVLLFAVDAFHREHMRDAASVSTVAPAQHAPPETLDSDTLSACSLPELRVSPHVQRHARSMLVWDDSVCGSSAFLSMSSSTRSASSLIDTSSRTSRR